MFKFSLSRLLSHWSLNLPVLLGLTLASALLMCIPGYATATAELSLQQSFSNETPVSRNIEITAAPEIMTGALNASIMETLGDLIYDRLTVQNIEFESNPSIPILSIDSSERLKPNGLSIWSFDKTSELLKIVEGAIPEYSRPYTQEEILRAMSQPPTVQAAISKDTADQSNMQLGDILVDVGGIKYIIVGIVEQVDPRSDIWWGDSSPFHITFIPGTNEDTIIIPLIIDATAVKEYFSGYDQSWRLLVDHSQLTPENIQQWEEKLLSLKTLLQKDQTAIYSDLPNLLLAFRINQATIRMVLLLLGSQSFIFIIFFLVLISSAALERSQGEISTMVGRGASSKQLITMLAIETGIMAILAGCVLGPLVSLLVFKGWALISGSLYTIRVTNEAFLFSLIGAGLGWIFLMIGMVPNIRRNILDWQKKISRPDRSNRWSNLYLDILLVILGGLVFWQLSTNGSFVIEHLRDTPQADPLLLLSPTILLIAISLILLRIFPYILKGLAWLARPIQGLLLPLGLSRISRNPVRYNQIVLMIGAAFGLMVFMITYETSLTINQSELAHYQSGADLRIIPGKQSLSELMKLPGIIQASQVLRLRFTTNTGSMVTLLAIDSQTFSGVSYYPEGMTNIDMEAITQILHWEGVQNQSTPGNDSTQNRSKIIPAVFSQSALPVNKGIGDTVQILVQGTPVNLSVRGIIVNFPTLIKSFILVDITALQSIIDLHTSTYHNMQEIWLETNPAQHKALVTNLSLNTKIIADTQTELLIIQNNAFTEGARRAFNLNAYLLLILSIVGFILLNYFNAHQRRFEFGILRATGVSIGQMITLLIGEGMLIMISGLGVGIGIGLGLVHSMRIFLNAALEKSFPGASVYQIIIDWPRVAQLTFVLVVAYFLATLVFLWFLIKSGSLRAIRIGEE